jgi:hypothetical protein
MSSVGSSVWRSAQFGPAATRALCPRDRSRPRCSTVDAEDEFESGSNGCSNLVRIGHVDADAPARLDQLATTSPRAGRQSGVQPMSMMSAGRVQVVGGATDPWRVSFGALLISATISIYAP